jgi:diketogulonate reductase-like aldo/keto reductase
MTVYSIRPLYYNNINMQVCIAFALHRGMVVIPKTVTPSRITENLKATEIKLDADDMKRLCALGDKNFRYASVSWAT